MKFNLSKILGSAVLLLASVAASLASEQVKIRFVVWDGDQSLKVIRKSIADFEKAHPNIKVQLENVEFNNYFRKLMVQYAAGVAPDVAMTGPDRFVQFARRGAFMPLEPLLEKSDVKIDEYYPPIIDGHSYDGKLYALPRDVAPFGIIYYNKKIFDEVGIPYPDGSWTWDFKERPELKEKDFLWVLKKLQKRDKNGKVTRYSIGAWWIGGLIDSFVYSQGLRYTDDDEHPNELYFNSPPIVKTYEFGADIVLKQRLAPSPTELNNALQSTADQLFMQQRTAMYMCGIWDVPKIRESLKPGSKEFFEWDIAPFPGFADGTKGTGSGGSGYAIMSSSKHPEESWKLVQWLAGPHGMRDMAAAGIAQPAIKSLARSDAWIPGPNTPLEEQYPRNRIITDSLTDVSVYPPKWEYWSQVTDFVNAKLELMWAGTLSVPDALNQGQAQAQKRLDQIKAVEALPTFNWPVAGGVALLIIALVVGWVYMPERNIKYNAMQKANSRAGYKFIAPWLIGMVLFTVGPMILSLLMSVADWDIMTPAKYRGAGNFTEAFSQDQRFWPSLTATGIYTFVSVPLGLMFSLLLALILNTKVRGIPFYRTFFYLPALASAVASSLIWKRIFQQEGGLLNLIIYGPSGEGNFLGLASLLAPLAKQGEMVNWLGSEKTALASLIMMSVWGAGGGMVILLAGLQGIPQTYYEAAELDGAGSMSKFRVITFPMLSPSLFFTMVTGFIGSFQVFTQAFVMTNGGPGDSTRFFMYHLYDQAFFVLRMGYASALGWVLFAIILFFTIVQFRLNKYVYYEGETR